MSPASPRIHLTRRIVQLQGNKASADILEQAKQICNDYVEAKLEREGIKNRGLSFAFSTQQSSGETAEKACKISSRVREVGELLELCYPRLYTDISSRVNVPFSSENAVHEVFNNVSSEILSDGLNWARIVALYTFAGALAAECCREGRNSFVLDIGNWMYEFAALYMVDWIKSKGGWEDLLQSFPCVTTAGWGYPFDSEGSRWCKKVAKVVATQQLFTVRYGTDPRKPSMTLEEQESNTTPLKKGNLREVFTLEKVSPLRSLPQVEISDKEND
ncbi:hypothetical protein ACROYT_G003125 [Oculina patagonica]